MFSALVGNYIGEWEGHTQMEGNLYLQLKDMIKEVTIDEINTVYNLLTQQKLWNQPLIDLFYNELLDRILLNTSFALRVMDNFNASVEVNFEDDLVLLADEYMVVDNMLSDKIRDTIIRMLLDGDISLIINESAIVGAQSSERKITWGENEIATMFPVINRSEDWLLITGMYNGVKSGIPGILDPFKNRS